MKRLLCGITALLLCTTFVLPNGVGDVGVDMREAFLEGADLSGDRLERADFTGAYLDDANLSEAILTEAVLREAFLESANLRKASLVGAELSGSFLDRADLTDADLTRAGLIGTFLHDADLSDADLSDADLSGADLTGVSLSGATLSGTNLTGASVDEEALVDVPIGAWIWSDRPPDYYDDTRRRWRWTSLLHSMRRWYADGELSKYEDTWIANELRNESAPYSDNDDVLSHDENMPDELNKFSPYLDFLSTLIACSSTLRSKYEETQERGIPKGCTGNR